MQGVDGGEMDGEGHLRVWRGLVKFALLCGGTLSKCSVPPLSPHPPANTNLGVNSKFDIGPNMIGTWVLDPSVTNSMQSGGVDPNLFYFKGLVHLAFRVLEKEAQGNQYQDHGRKKRGLLPSSPS